jgi:hypothetical protein
MLCPCYIQPKHRPPAGIAQDNQDDPAQPVVPPAPGQPTVSAARCHIYIAEEDKQYSGIDWSALRARLLFASQRGLLMVTGWSGVTLGPRGHMASHVAHAFRLDCDTHDDVSHGCIHLHVCPG